MPALSQSQVVGVIGAGTMGAGIAQVAAAAGHRVRLYDGFAGAARAGKGRISSGLDSQVERGRMARGEADALLERIVVTEALADLADAGLVIEAIIEDLDAKRRLLAQLEAIVSPQAILAMNTSSISVTAIASPCRHPDRIVGAHFFNPAPVMKLVEVVSGVTTAPAVAEIVFDTVAAWGKTAVHARSTPGFVVNRVARPFYAEALRLLEEQVANPQTLDALLVQSGGFRMGPFELMDLIGNDVNYAVTVSIFNAFYNDPRFRPSIAQLELINAGRLGRKTGRGFYEYGDQSVKMPPDSEPALTEELPLSGFVVGRAVSIDGVHIALTDGRTAADRSASVGQPVILVDLTAPPGKFTRVGYTASADVTPTFQGQFVATLQGQGLAVTRLPDWPGLVVMRTVAMLANEAFEACMQGVAHEAGIDAAMRNGVNYPQGPAEWARLIGLTHVLAVLDNIHDQTLDPRYRASMALRSAAKRSS